MCVWEAIKKKKKSPLNLGDSPILAHGRDPRVTATLETVVLCDFCLAGVGIGSENSLNLKVRIILWELTGRINHCGSVRTWPHIPCPCQVGCPLFKLGGVSPEVCLEHK